MGITEKIKLSQNTALISGIFCITVALLLLLNFWQVTKSDPIKSEALKVLVERLSKEPKNQELIKEIRSFDLLARKAYFNSDWQVKTGSYMLLFGAIVCAVALRYYYTLKSRIEKPDQDSENEITGRILAQKWVLISGAFLLLLALLSSFFTVDYLKQYSTTGTMAAEQPETSTEQIEVIKVTGDTTTNTLKNDSVMSVVSGTISRTSDNPAAQVSGTSAAPVGGQQLQARLQSGSFRGPYGQGISYCKNIPVKWNGTSGDNILWKVKVPRAGFNSPVIWGDKLFISGADNQARELFCYDRNTGKLLWSKQLANIAGSPAAPPKVSTDTGLAAPSVATDGSCVCVLFATGDVAGYDLDGNLLWAKNIGVPDNHYGHSSSPILYKSRLFIQFDTNRGSRLMALNASNGEKIWETTRNVKISWASPILAMIGGKMQVILSADPVVAGYDTDSGKELWTVECLFGEVGPSPAYSDGLVFAGQEYAKFAAIDPTVPKIVWESDEYLPEVSSPVASGGLVFLATSFGVLACYDAKTGTKYWENESPSGYYSSPVIAENKLYALDLQGNMLIFEVSKEKKVVGECPLGEKATTTPAFSDGRIYIRGDNNLYCIGK